MVKPHPKSRMKKGGAFAAGVMAFIAGWEGVSYVAYRDVVGVLTICHGETRNVKPGERRTKEECDWGLYNEILIHEAGMLKCAPQLERLPDGPYKAQVSAGFNIGVGAWCGSSMARAIRAGDVAGSCEALMKWNKGRIGGVLVPISGLTNRRTDERRVCRAPTDPVKLARNRTPERVAPPKQTCFLFWCW